jgi:hypothetical protein
MCPHALAAVDRELHLASGCDEGWTDSPWLPLDLELDSVGIGLVAFRASEDRIAINGNVLLKSVGASGTGDSALGPGDVERQDQESHGDEVEHDDG